MRRTKVVQTSNDQLKSMQESMAFGWGRVWEGRAWHPILRNCGTRVFPGGRSAMLEALGVRKHAARM